MTSAASFPDLTVAVFGTGSAGRRHLSNVIALGAAAIACSSRVQRSVALEDGQAIEATSDAHTAIRQADAIVIANATDRHIVIAREAALARKPMYIEKPLSHDDAGVAELRARATGLIVEIGCQLRAHPALQELKRRVGAGSDGAVLAFRGCVGQRLDTWRPGTDYRKCYSADRRRGGGALFDLVHEVDLAHWICGPFSGVFARLAKVSDQDIDADDLANLILESRSGACGSLQLDMVSAAYRRSFEVICERANYEWTYAEGTLWRRSGEDVRALATVGATFQRNDLFRAHMSHFLQRVLDPRIAPLCSLEDAISCLGLLLAARRSAESGTWLELRQQP